MCQFELYTECKPINNWEYKYSQSNDIFNMWLLCKCIYINIILEFSFSTQY